MLREGDIDNQELGREFRVNDLLVNSEEEKVNNRIQNLFEKGEKEALIELGEKGEGKFIIVEDEEENSYIVSLPLENFFYIDHGSIGVYIQTIAEEKLKKKIKVKGGGILKVKGDKLVVGGSSEKYGKPDFNYVKDKIEKAFPGIKVEIEIKQ